MAKYTEKFEQEIGFKVTGADVSKKQTKEIEKAFRDLAKSKLEVSKDIVRGDEVKKVEEVKEIYENIMKDRSKSLKNDFKTVKQTVKTRLAAAKIANKQLTTPTKGGVAGFFQTGSTKAKNTVSAFKGIGGQLKGMTKMGGTMTKVMGSLSGVMGALGISLGALSSLGAFVALLVASDKHVKEMNKSILNTVANTGELNYLLGGVPNIEPEFNIRNIRNSMNNLFMDYRVGQQDALDALKEFGEQGINVRTILGETTKEWKGLATEGEYTLEGIQTAAVFSHQLGKTTSETAKQMAEWSATLGISVGMLKDDFTILTKDAQESGLGVNRFFAAVQNASAGLDLYGIRATEVSATLLKMGKNGAASMETMTNTSKDAMQAMRDIDIKTAAFLFGNEEGLIALKNAVKDEKKEIQERLKALSKGHDLQKLQNMTQEELHKTLGDTAAEFANQANRIEDLSSALASVDAGNIEDVKKVTERLGGTNLEKLFGERLVSVLAQQEPDPKQAKATLKLSKVNEKQNMILQASTGLSRENINKIALLNSKYDRGYKGTLAGMKAQNTLQKYNLDAIYDQYDEQAKMTSAMKTPMTAAIGEATNAILTNLYDISRTVFKAILKILPGSLNEKIYERENNKQINVLSKAIKEQIDPKHTKYMKSLKDEMAKLEQEYVKTESDPSKAKQAEALKNRMEEIKNEYSKGVKKLAESNKAQQMLGTLNDIKKVNDPRMQMQQLDKFGKEIARGVFKDNEKIVESVNNLKDRTNKAIEKQPGILGKIYNLSMLPITKPLEFIAKILGKIPGLGFMGKAGETLENPAGIVKDIFNGIGNLVFGEKIDAVAPEGMSVTDPHSPIKATAPEGINFQKPIESKEPVDMTEVIKQGRENLLKQAKAKGTSITTPTEIGGPTVMAPTVVSGPTAISPPTTTGPTAVAGPTAVGGPANVNKTFNFNINVANGDPQKIVQKVREVFYQEKLRDRK